MQNSATTPDVDGSIDIEELGEILNIRFPDGNTRLSAGISWTFWAGYRARMSIRR